MTRGPDAERRRALARHADEETRYRAVAALEPGDREDRAVLLERLADASWRVRSAAVERLAAAIDALPALLDVLAVGPTVGAREAAAAALARLGGAALPSLVERLGARDPELRQAAASVLGALGDGRAAARLPDGPLELRVQDLQRDGAVVLEVVGEIDRRHAPAPELPLDAVAVGEGGNEVGPGVGHR